MVCVENCMYVPLLCVEPGQYEVIALTVLSVPVFDTLRVMTTRILKRKSPFHPDKTHLHHMFIRLGCSHAATTPPCVRYYSSRVFSRGGLMWPPPSFYCRRAICEKDGMFDMLLRVTVDFENLRCMNPDGQQGASRRDL